MENTRVKYTSFLFWFFLIIVFETIILLKIVDEELLLFKLLLNYLFLIAVIPLIFEKINKGCIDPFSPFTVFTFFYLLLFGMTAFDLLIFNPDIIRKDEKFYNLALFYSIIGLHFFQIGYHTKIGKLILNKKKIPDKWSVTRIKVLLILYSIISILSFMIMITISGGFSFYFSNIQNAMLNIVSGSAVFFMSVLLVKIPLVIWFYFILVNKKLSLFFLLFFIIVLFLFISLGERGHLIGLIISLLTCYHYVKNRVKILPLAVFGVILALFLVVSGQYREFTAYGYKIKKAGFNVKLNFPAMYHKLMNDFDQLIRVKDIIKKVPDQLDFQFGKTFFNLMFKPIPSRIWAEKPQGGGYVVTKYLYPSHFAAKASVAPSLLGELYINFHIIGVISGMFLFGVLCNGLFLLLKKKYHNKNFIVFYALFLPGIFGQLRGDFAVVSSFHIFNLCFLIIALNYITIRNGREKQN